MTHHKEPVPLWDHELPQAPAGTSSTQQITDTARDAAQRAQALLDGRPYDPDPLVDLVRLLHGRPQADAEAAAERAGLRLGELRRLRNAFTFGGSTGVHVCLHLSDADPAVLTAATQDIARRRGSTTGHLKIEYNRLTDAGAGVQIRLGPDRLWYPFTAAQDDWVPAPRPTNSPADAYQAACTALRNRRG